MADQDFCNVMTIGGHEFAPDFVRFSFSQPTQRPINFYCFAATGHVMNLDREHVGLRYLFDDHGETLFQVIFLGFEWFVTQIDITKETFIALGGCDSVRAGAQFVDRPRCVDCAEQNENFLIPRCSLQIDWDRPDFGRRKQESG